MGSNTEKEAMNQSTKLIRKIQSKDIKSKTFAIVKLEER